MISSGTRDDATFISPVQSSKCVPEAKQLWGSAASSARLLLPVIYIETGKKIAQSIYSSFLLLIELVNTVLHWKDLCRSYISQGIMHSHKAVTDSKKAKDKGKTA